MTAKHREVGEEGKYAFAFKLILIMYYLCANQWNVCRETLLRFDEEYFLQAP